MTVILAVSTACGITSIATAQSDYSGWRSAASSLSENTSTLELARRQTASGDDYGHLLDRKLIRTVHSENVDQTGQTRLVTHVFESNYRERKLVIETVTLQQDGDHWRLVSHHIQ